jgi:hypothetical protein
LAELVDDEILYGPVGDARLLLTGYLLPCRIAPVVRTGTRLTERAPIYRRATHEDVLSPGTVSHQDPSITWRGTDIDIDTKEEKLHGFALVSRFTGWALPIVEFRIPPFNDHARHCGLLLKRTAEGIYARLGIYRIRNFIMDKIEGKQCIHQDVWLIWM